jgi:hypothetical protein
VIAVGGGMVAAGPFLPWVSVGLIGDIQGLRFGDGVWQVGLGLLLVAIGGLVATGPTARRRRAAIVVSLLCLFLVAFDFLDVQGQLSSAGGAVGAGLWLAVLGAVIALIASLTAPPRSVS